MKILVINNNSYQIIINKTYNRKYIKDALIIIKLSKNGFLTQDFKLSFLNIIIEFIFITPNFS